MKQSVKIFVIFLASFLVHYSVFAVDCPLDAPKTTIFYVNGVDNDLRDARWSKRILEEKFTDFLSKAGPRPPGFETGCLRFDLAYNDNEPWILDLFEASRQRLGIHSSIFWRLYAGLIGAVGLELLEQYNQVFIDQIVHIDLNSYVIDADLARHVQQYRAEIRGGKRVLVVAHSQGNLYANQAYGNLFNGPEALETKSFGIVSVATPASSVEDAVRGEEPYTTLAEDLVILAVEAILPSTLDSNVSNGLISKDSKGHSFVDAYLIGLESESEPQIMLHMIAVIFGLERPRPEPVPFRLRLEDLGTGMGVVITDQGPGDFNPTVGAITFTGTIPGGWIANVTTGLSKPVSSGPTALAYLDLNSVNVQSAGPGTLRITLEDTSYTGGSDGPLELNVGAGGTLIAPSGSTATFQSRVNPNDLVPAFGPDTLAIGPLPAIGGTPPGSIAAGSLTFGPGAFAGSNSVAFTKAGPYSLFTQATITVTGPGNISFDQESTVISPESDVWLSFVEGDPGIPGDGLVAAQNSGVFHLQHVFSLAGVTTGLTVSVYPPSSIGVGESPYIQPQIGLLFHVPGRQCRPAFFPINEVLLSQFNGVQGFGASISQQDLNLILRIVRGTSGCEDISSLDQIVLERISTFFFYPFVIKFVMIDQVDGVALYLGQNMFASPPQ